MLSSTFTRPPALGSPVSRRKDAVMPAPAIVKPNARTDTSADSDRLNT